MAKLTVYTDRGVRSAVAKQFLLNLGIDFDEITIDETPSAVEFLESKNRNTRHFPCPQFYVNGQLAWANGFKDVSGLSAEQINEKVEEINANI